ncbi:uncharacterized protein V1516DRAFT_676178 [Lipomyces oligophaga]|uniref:uncharacterized protein n=1 Tax=Lipomyces oligophaga TaxID=45792 RepID=UPI0034CEF7F4
MGSKRKRSSRKSSSSRNRPRYRADDSETDLDLAVRPRSTRRQISYAESDSSDSEFNELRDDDDDDDDEEPEAEETGSDDDQFESDEDESKSTRSARSTRSLVKLKLRKQRSDGLINDESDSLKQDFLVKVDNSNEFPERGIAEQNESGQTNGEAKEKHQDEEADIEAGGIQEVPLSAASIRQQLMQHKKTEYKKQSRSSKRSNRDADDDDDFEVDSSSVADDDEDDDEEEENIADDPEDDDDAYSLRPRSNVSTRSQQRSRNADEIQDELADLSPPEYRRKNLRQRKDVNYQLIPPPDAYDDMFFQPSDTRKRTNTNNTWRLYSTYGPFGGAGVQSILGARGRNDGLTAAGGAADSDSSDDEAAIPKTPLAKPPTAADLEAVTNPSSALGLVNRKSNLSDTDPLGVDMNVDFSAVGGLDDHINQLKEMVALPLMYPEVFQRFKVTPPRGVLFHGPPGTGKTLLARALAASCSANGRKISFYMRKGADALSKWVGEAERQLRLLFEEAKNTQPSIIFFDEIDGLAPVRSSKQEQIHASIVSTLLALMDGMDNRGQVVVIGATNRPDSVDPALRRPGRFDREFYFPLPNLEARKKIIEIQTKAWDPPLDPTFISEVGSLTKGYGGADLRALCTESALNAIQRRYPQIYTHEQKLLIDPSSINVLPRDFILSLKKIIPSSQRSTASNAAPLPKRVEPLLSLTLDAIKKAIDNVIPRKKRLTIAEEAQYEDDSSDGGFMRENMMQDFESSRLFRPRILIAGSPGMGQEYLGAAVLQYLEGYHVQNFDLATLLSDSTRTVEAAIVQLFVEVKRHAPSVIFIPSIDSWIKTISPSAWTTFQGLLRSISPVEQILLLGFVENDFAHLDHELKALFGFSKANRIEIYQPGFTERHGFFAELAKHISNSPSEYPDLENRKKRKLEILPLAPPPPPKVLTKAELKAQEEKDKRLKNYLKIKLSGLMELIKNRYKRFRKPMIDDDDLRHLFEPIDPAMEYEYVLTEDDMILQRSTGHKYYNMDLDVVEDRLWNGYYSMPKQFLQDIGYILADANTSGDREKILKASEMYANVQVSVDEIGDAQFLLDCERVYRRDQQRTDFFREKMKKKQEKIAAIQREHLAAAAIEDVMPVNGDSVPTKPTRSSTEPTTVITKTSRPIESLFSDEEDLEDPIENKTAEVAESRGPKNADIVMIDASSPILSKAEANGIPPTEPSPKVIDDVHHSEKDHISISSSLPLPIAESVEVVQTDNVEEMKESTPSPELEQEPEPASSPIPQAPEHDPYELSTSDLTIFQEEISRATEKYSIEQLEQLNSALMNVAYQRRLVWDRNVVLKEVKETADEIMRDIAITIERD